MKKSQVLVILCNDDFTKQDVMDQVNSIMADNKLCRDLGMIKNFGGKILKPETNIYTAKKYVDEIEAIYAGVDNVNIKSVIDLDEQKALEDYEAEDSKVITNGRYIKFMGKDISPRRTGGEFCYMIKFSRKGSRLFFDKIESFLRKEMLNVYLMDVINALIKSGVNIVSYDASGIPVIEVDFMHDLRDARRKTYPLVVDKL